VGRLLLTLGLVFGAAAPASANNWLERREEASRRRANPDVTIEEKIGGQVPMDLTFRDSTGKDVTLGECVGGKPTVLVLAYYRCPMNCTDVLNGLLDAMKAMPDDFSVGTAFNVLTVSFDPKEQPGLAAEKKKVYVDEYVRGTTRPRDRAEDGWHFLTGQKGAIERLTDAVGFRYVYDKVYKEYDHPTGVIVLTPSGKVARYFYGHNYDGEYRVPGGTTSLRLTLVEASDGKVGSLLDRLILSCYRFDHLEKNYSFNILLAVRAGGIITVLALAAAVTVFVVRDRRRHARRAAGGVAAGAGEITTDGPAGEPQTGEGAK
jgi:protein SCO1/2